jgi:N-glycosylase/DNA lyase
LGSNIENLREVYRPVQGRIEDRLSEFSRIWESRDDEAMLRELLFCLLTPQSKAKVCWGAISEMACSDVLLKGTYDEVLASIAMVRFKYKKAGFLITARGRFSGDGGISLSRHIESLGPPREARGWFAENIKGMGYKEASHFLRNIGLGADLAILDRHVLRNMKGYGIIEAIPSHISKKDYLLLEGKVEEFSDRIGIPMDHLDMLLWYKEAGDVFK